MRQCIDVVASTWRLQTSLVDWSVTSAVCQPVWRHNCDVKKEVRYAKRAAFAAYDHQLFLLTNPTPSNSPVC